MYVCTYLHTYVCMYVCMYVCNCVHVCIYVYMYPVPKLPCIKKNVKISLLSFMYVCISYDGHVKLLNFDTFLAIRGSQLYACRPDRFGPIERVHKRKDSWVPQQSYRLWCSWFPHR